MPRTILCLAIATLALAPATRAAADAPDDRAAAQQIAQDLKDSGQLRDYRVGVKFQNGVAWLMGTVTSPEQKQTAEQLALRSAGVDRVINKLEVSAPAEKVSVQQAGGVNADEYEMQPAQQAARPTAMPMPARNARNNTPMPYARVGQGPVQQANYGAGGMGAAPAGYMPTGMGAAPSGMAQPVVYDNAQMPGYAWPSYASYPNYAAVTYPQQYSPTAWPYIGPFYPYPQVPLGWRKVTLEWDDGWWFLDFKDCKDCH
jgi:hypothetical protein